MTGPPQQDVCLSYSNDLPLTFEGLDFSQIDVARIRHHEDLFFLLCSSSFVKSGAHFHAQNLAGHFVGDEELRGWLTQHWEQQELQHGRALTAYIKAVWPEFDWDKGFKSFCNEYGAICAGDPLEPSRGLELAALCVVETSIASRYRALNEITDEPVLKQLTNHIKSAEVGHYKYFHQCYRQYQQRERFGRYQALRVMLRRIKQIRMKQSDIAMRHVFNQCFPQHLENESEFRRLSDRVHRLLCRHLPTSMTAKMLLKPLNFPVRLQAALERPLAKFTERLFVR
jgi:hypothetical protein